MTPLTVQNINFHGVGTPPRKLDEGEAKVWLSAARFSETLAVLRGRGDVCISFDDGNRSDVELALPALLERDMTATFFVLAGRLDHSDYLDADDVRELAAAGMTIGSHGLHHRDWRRLSDEQLAREILLSRRILEEVLGRPVTRAAVPFGSYDRRVLARARRGYDRVFTSDGGPSRPDAWLQARTTVADDGVAPSAVTERPTAGEIVERGLKRMVKRWR